MLLCFQLHVVTPVEQHQAGNITFTMKNYQNVKKKKKILINRRINLAASCYTRCQLCLKVKGQVEKSTWPV